MEGKRHGGQKTGGQKAGGQKAWGAKGRGAKDPGAKDRGAKDRGVKDRGVKVLSPPGTHCVSRRRPAGTLLCRVHTVLAVGGQLGHCYAGYILR